MDCLALLIASTIVGYFAALRVGQSCEKRSRHFWLLIGVGINLGILFYFKYTVFFAKTYNTIVGNNSSLEVFIPEIILPVGVSFFVFQVVSYIVDVYREDVTPARSFLRFSTYVCMFPQLVAGPIVRYKDVEEQIETHSLRRSQIEAGVKLFMAGFIKKVLIANNIASLSDLAFSLKSPSFLQSFFGTLSYTFQIYFDFCGYTDMAIGLGLMLGFRFIKNFNCPYHSTSITDFWRRWHISMSTFFRDYLYISLGGNRGNFVRTLLNLVVTMLLAGLWHGAGWTFVLWGLAHGLFLAAERICKQFTVLRFVQRLPRVARKIITFIVIASTWIIFRADNWDSALSMYSGFVVMDFKVGLQWLEENTEAFFWMIFASASIYTILEKSLTQKTNFPRLRSALLLTLFLISIHELFGQAYNPFLYFQF